MSVADAALHALFQWPREEAEVMVAIAGAESNWYNGAQGDALSSFPADQQARYAPYDCGGYLSFGLWQIFQGVHFTQDG